MQRVLYGTASTVVVAAMGQYVLGKHSSLTKAANSLLQAQPWTLVMCNTALVLLIAFSKLFQKVFFGPLKLEEWSYLSSRIMYTVVEFTVAFVVVKEPVTLRWLAMLAVFLSVKWFHWLSASRVELSYSDVKHWRLRLTAAFALLHFCDIQWLRYYFTEIISKGERSMLTIILAFEMSILYNSLMATTAQFVLNSVDDYLGPGGLVAKDKVLFVIKLVSDLVRLCMYLIFSAVLLAHFCIPLHIFRESYLTLRISITKLRNLIRHKHLISKLDQHPFDPNVATSPSEPQQHSSSLVGDCIICRDSMDAKSHRLTTIKCGHTLHYACLFEWLRQSSSCPICRTAVDT